MNQQTEEHEGIVYWDVVPLHTLKRGDTFCLTTGSEPIEVDYQHPMLAKFPEGHLQVIRVQDNRPA